MKFLSEDQRNFLISQHKQERDKRVCDRIKAVLLYDKGWSHAEIADVLLLSDEGVRQHILDYKSSQKIRPQNGGSEGKLTKTQIDELCLHLQGHIYLYVKDIIKYVSATYQVTYTTPGMRNWLHLHGFSYKKPAIVPGKADCEAQKKWIAEYEVLRNQLLPNQTICFMDGVHPTHNTIAAYGWIKVGQRKEIPTNTGRSRLNISAMIDMLTRRVVLHEDKTLNTASTIAFFRKVEDAYPTMDKIHMFCDNARYYRNYEVAEYLKESKIQLHFLPPYSPNLNPIERLWKLLKERVLYNSYYEDFLGFKEAILGFLKSLSSLSPDSDLGQALASRVRDKFEPIGSCFANS